MGSVRRSSNGPWTSVALIALLLVPALALAVPPAATNPPTPATVTPFASGPCGGARVPAVYSGALSVIGGLAPLPNVSGVMVEATYAYELNLTQSGQPPKFTCETGTSTNLTVAGGAFSLTLSIPSSTYSHGTYSTYTGPYAPLAFSIPATPPSGFFVKSSVNGTAVAFDYVYALSSVTLTPFGRTTVSLSAPVSLTVAAFAADGSPSPAALTYNWTLGGTGWAVEGAYGGATFKVISTPGASVGTVTVGVNGTYTGRTERVPVQQAVLTAVATTVVAGGVTPTALDVGAPATFTLDGSGSAGYSYSATVFPGLGTPDVTVPCTTSFASGGLVSISCDISVSYATPGEAHPSANLTNGYSAADYAFAAITVAPALSIVVGPSPLLAYVNAPTTVSVSVTGDTGTAPFGPACVWPGDGRLLCSFLGSTSWTIPVAYARTGTFGLRATVADSAGSNRSVTVAASIFPRPNLTAIVAPSETTDMGVPLELSSTLEGGALPAPYWWNDSVGSTLASGLLSADGPLNLTFYPQFTGPTNVSLTVVDALGTRVSSEFEVVVRPGAAQEIVPAAASASWNTTAGTAYAVSWAAVDAGGDVDPGFSANVSIWPKWDPDGILWVNATGGPVGANASGAFVLPAFEWTHGYLNFTITPGTEGMLPLAVASRLPVSVARNGTIDLGVEPDLAHLLLTRPEVTLASGANDTLWTIEDRFGNYLEYGYVVVETSIGGVTSDTRSPILWNGATSSVWVNVTLPASGTGTVTVRSQFGETLLPLTFIGGTPGVSPLELGVVLGLAAAGVVCLAMAVRGRRWTAASGSASSAPPPPPDSVPTEADLKRLADGRAHVLARAHPVEPRSVAELVDGWRGPPPDPAEAAEWVSSLVVEGLLRPVVTDDGVPKFVRLPKEAPPPKVDLDPSALDAALARRPTPEDDEDRGDDPAPPA